MAAFSRKMGPSALGEWLRGEYGEEYQEDIDVLKKAKINGSLFLELDLPERKELLKKLDLPIGFEELVLQKAKELKESEGVDGDTVAVKNGGCQHKESTELQASSNPTSMLLTMDHFSQVKEAIWDARNKYDHFGVAVGIDQDTIDAIERSCKKAEECFTQVLKECLRNGITQKKISDALKSRTVGYGRMGEDFLAVKFETPQKPTSTSATPITTGVWDSVKDFDQFEVRNHHLGMLEWTSGASSGKITLYDSAQYKWEEIAERLGLEPGLITSINRSKFDDRQRVTTVFEKWLSNANQLPNRSRYPKKWSGLIKLLEDSGLGQLSQDLEKALKCPVNSVRGNHKP